MTGKTILHFACCCVISPADGRKACFITQIPPFFNLLIETIFSIILEVLNFFYVRCSVVEVLESCTAEEMVLLYFIMSVPVMGKYHKNFVPK